MTAISWGEEAITLAPELDSPTVDDRRGPRPHDGGDLHADAGRLPQPRSPRSFACATQIDDQFSIAFAGSGVAISLGAADQVRRSEPILAIGVAAAYRSGNPHAIALTSLGQGTLLARTGRSMRPCPASRRRSRGSPRSATSASANAARSEIAHALRAPAGPTRRWRPTGTRSGRWVRTGARGAVAHQLESIAFLCIDTGDVPRAARLLGAAASLAQAARNPMTSIEAPEYEGYVERLRARDRGSEVLDAELAAGRRLSMAEAVALAVAPDAPAGS